MHPQSGPPSQPSMSASGPPSGPSPYAFDAARRRSLNGMFALASQGAQVPALAHQASSHAELPTASSHEPPSFARPQMPPPSSPTQQPTHPSQPQRPPYSSNFAPSRELPGLGQAHRPGSSMSISSLIGGGDAGAVPQTSQPQTSPPTNPLHPNTQGMQPPSPRRAFPSGGRSDFAPFRRQPSPDRLVHGSHASRAESHAFSAGSPPSRPYSNQGSPIPGRQSLPPSQHGYKPSGFASQRLFGPLPNDPLARDAHLLPGSVPPRPNSQPNGPSGLESASPHENLGGRRSAYGQPEERRRTLGEQSRPDAAELLRGIGQGAMDRNRPVTVHPVSQSAFDPPRDQHATTSSSEPSRSLWRPPMAREPPREPAEPRREEPSALYRSYGTYPPPISGPSLPHYGPPTLSEMVPRRSLDQINNRVVEQYHAPPTSDPNSKERHQTEPLTRSFSSGGTSYPGRSMYGEPMQHSKSHIGLGLEESRRTGRASPLPQAVQGAQAPPFMTGKDPGIKSEFGRMFSGLGGLGSTTPLRGSPLPQTTGQDGPESAEMMRRISSQQGRKPKRVKDESNVFDDDSNDGRGTPTGVRGAKRNKHAHPPGHHHHHPAHHQ
jgi:hypothetical protein